jgi:hypothetical protein
MLNPYPTRFDEVRPTLYDTEMFQDSAKEVDGFAGVRDVHVGLDIGGPVGTPVSHLHVSHFLLAYHSIFFLSGVRLAVGRRAPRWLQP